MSQTEWGKLVEAAAKEGELVVYTSLGGTEPTFEQFEKAYPQINVTVEQTPTADLISRLDQEIEVNAPGADVAFHAQTSWYRDRAENGSLAAVKLSAEAVQAGWTERLGDREYKTVYAFPYFIGYNSSTAKKVSSVKELVDQAGAAKVGILDAAAATAVSFQYDLWLKAYGADFMERLSKLDVKMDSSATTLAQSLAAGELDYVANMVPGLLEPLKADGASVDWVVPSENLSGPHYNVAALSSARHPNAAQLFVDWLGNRQAQELMIKKHSPGSVPVQVKGSIPWGDVATYKEEDWPKSRWDKWLADEWTGNFG
ncbi:ABC transporter substrate-binding protein [Kribbella caucasensis]|uniref:ABC transporter substrate-binding protein n=1 Tax=Kribbella caucasensis TaxID=2512215 RepID=UPI0014152EC4|nr:extracellular solute-binding protein [Kribbella sp. VKM Ac-2527]